MIWECEWKSTGALEYQSCRRPEPSWTLHCLPLAAIIVTITHPCQNIFERSVEQWVGVDFMQGRKTNDNAIMTTQHLTTTRNDSPLKGLSLIQGMPYCMEKGLSLLLCLAVKRGQHSPFIFYHAISSFCTCHYPSINCFYISAFCLVQSWQIMLAYSSWWCIQWYSVNKVIIDKFRKKNSAILKLCLREFSLNMMILSGVTYFVH